VESPPQIPGLRVDRLIGEGGFGQVWSARRLADEQRVAVKILHLELVRSIDALTRFQRELDAIQRLHHSNVVRALDHGTLGDGRPYLVLELITGPSLREVIQERGPLPPDEVLAILEPLCDALAVAHAAGLVHRDVKPQNLLIARTGTLKVADFGIARGPHSGTTDTGTILGTAAYLPPEQARGEEVGPAADVYGLGAVLYELLTGRPPRPTGSLAEVAGGMLEPILPPSRLVELPQGLERVVMRALANRPEHRPASARELAAELRDATRAQPASERPTERLASGPARGSRPGRGLRVAGLTLVGALVLLGGALGLERAVDASEPGPAEVDPVPRADSAEEQARNLAEWLRGNAG
jgi:serine/threonine protein kinase